MPLGSPRSSRAVSRGSSGPPSRGGQRASGRPTPTRWVRGAAPAWSNRSLPGSGCPEYVFGETWGPVWLVVVPLVILAMVVGPWAKGLGMQLRTWSVAYPAYLAAVLDPFTSIFRYLIPMFPLLAVMVGAGWEDRRGDRVAQAARPCGAGARAVHHRAVLLDGHPLALHPVTDRRLPALRSPPREPGALNFARANDGCRQRRTGGRAGTARACGSELSGIRAKEQADEGALSGPRRWAAPWRGRRRPRPGGPRCGR